MTSPNRHATWPRVTLACYARENDPNFAAALERAGRQRYPGLEVLGAQFDPGSKTRTVVAALNELAEQAQGEYVLFFHPGEYVADDFLLQVVTHLKSQSEPLDFIYGTRRPTHTGQRSGEHHVLPIPAAYAGRNEFRELLRGEPFPLGATIIRRSLLLRLGNFSEDFGDRYALEFFLRITRNGALGGFTPYAAMTEHEALEQPHSQHNLTAGIRHDIALYDTYLTAENWPRISGIDGALSAKIDQISEAFQRHCPAGSEPELGVALATLTDRLQFLQEMPENSTLSQRPLVSIIVMTCGERLPELERALRSIFAQTLTNYEIILVQNGGASLAPYVHQMHDEATIRFVYIPCKMTPTLARNCALRLATGHYYAYLDEDNAFHPEHLQILVSRIDAADADFTYSGANVHIHGTGGQEDAYETDVFSNINAHTLITTVPSVNLNAVLHRAKLAEDSEYLDSKLPILDDWFYILCMLNGTKVTVPGTASTLDIHLTAPPYDSEFGRRGLYEIVRCYDAICDRVPLPGRKENENRAAFRAQLFQLNETWNERLSKPAELMQIIKQLNGFDLISRKNGGTRVGTLSAGATQTVFNA